MSILSKVNSALEEEGLGYVIQRAPHYIKRRVQSKISDGAYKIYNPYGKLSRGDMISHCKNNDQIWYYGSSEHFEISPPLTGATPEQLQDLVGTYECPESFVCELNDVRLVGDRAIPQLKDGRFVLEELGKESMLKSRVLNSFSRSFNNREKIQQILAPKDNVCCDYDYHVLLNMVPRHGCNQNDYINFAHWLLEDLPRLWGYREYYNTTGRKPTVLIKSDPPSWMIDTLQLLGLSSTDWTEWNQNEAVVSRLVIPQLGYIHSFGTEFQPAGRSWVSNQVRSKMDTLATDQFPDRVFISRQNQDRRKIKNFDELIAFLSNFGFEAVRPEEISIKNQVRLFNQAEMIIGPSGAGLANMIFSDDASVIELQPSCVDFTVWYVIANECGLRYDNLSAECAEKCGSNGVNHDNIYIDTNELEETIQKSL